MALKTICDECGTALPDDRDPRYKPPADRRYMKVTAPYAADADYCSPRCAVIAFGGTWPDDGAPQPSHGNHYRTIPWPPSDELVERVAAAVYTATNHFPKWGDIGDGEHAWWRVHARAVLDAIGGAQ